MDKKKRTPEASESLSGTPSVSDGSATQEKTGASENVAADVSPETSAFSRFANRFPPGFRKAFVVTAAVAALAFGFFHFSETSVPTVVGGNFDFGYRKIPYNVPSIDFTFSTALDPATVSNRTVTVSPAVAGMAALSSENVVSYRLSERLEIGKRYVFTLSADIATPSGIRMGTERTFELEAVSAAKVVRMIPEGETDRVGKNPVFLFNVPVVALSSLSEKDAVPCPVTFEPALSGRCSWLSGNALEYRLDAPLRFATEYRLRLDSNGLLYPLETVFSGSFSTPRLALLPNAGEPSDRVSFRPSEGMPVRFSAEVSKSELEKRLSVFEGLLKEPAGFKVAGPGGSDVSNVFFVTGKNGPFPHSNDFEIRLSEGLPPAV